MDAATNEAEARRAHDAFETECGQEYPTIVKAWRSRWGEVTPFLSFRPEIRRAVCATDAIDAHHRLVRKSLKTKGHLPNDDPAFKLIYSNVQTASRWKRAPQYWLKARSNSLVYVEGRFPQSPNEAEHRPLSRPQRTLHSRRRAGDDRGRARDSDKFSPTRFSMTRRIRRVR